MEKLMIIDGNSILNRAYYGIRPLTAPDGTPTNAVYGFLNIMFKYLDEEKPDYLCVAFDVKEKTFRHKMYDLYKAQRKPAPEDFLVQLPLIKEVLGAMNCLCLELPGFEADDIIGTVSRICDESKIQCRILTGDKDDLQLCSDNTVVKLVVTKGGKTETTDFGVAEFTEKYNMTPDSFIDLKALMGDSSDNIPGVKGIGEKTATTLIQSYKTIDEIYSNIDTIDVTDSVRKKLTEDKDGAYLSYKLATIDRNVPIDFSVDNARISKYNNSELAKLFTRLNFGSFIKKLELDISDTNEYEAITGNGKEVAFSELVKAAKSADKTAYCVCDDVLYVKPYNSDIGFSAKISKDELREFLADSEIKKVGFDVKKDIISASDFGITSEGAAYSNIVFDVMLAAYILDPSQSEYKLDTLCIKYLSQALNKTNDKTENAQISMLDIINNDECDYFAHLVAIERLEKIMSQLLIKNGQEKLYFDVELPLCGVLAELQINGMYVDKTALESFGQLLNTRISELKSEIFALSEEEFNINSPKQLGVILFEKLGLPGGKKNKSGGYSTNIDVMEKLKDKHTVIPLILEYRQLTKLQSTYVTGLSAVISPDTCRIHSSFNQTVTATGRISSTEPNLQNIPVRTELGRELRRMFRAEKDGWSFIDADYSQIELRVLAHVADDENMKKAFLDGADIHASTAATVFGVPLSEVTTQMRFRAKAVNFGIVYGIGAFSLAQDIGTSRKEAQEYIEQYLSHYNGVSEYMEKTIKFASENGYITTVLNRRRYLPELASSSHLVKAFGERVAKNAPIQGSAADIIKIAMVNVSKRLKSEGLKARLVLQVHDELIVEAPDNELESASAILKEEMENAFKLSVPLVVDMNSGKSWYDTK